MIGPETLERLRVMLVAWHAELGEAAVTVADVIAHAGTAGALYATLVAFGATGRPEARALGYALRGLHGRACDGLELVHAGETRDHARRWRVRRAGDASLAGDALLAGDTNGVGDAIGFGDSPAWWTDDDGFGSGEL